MPNSNDEERRKRLALALRENLKRRKAQARGRREISPDIAADPVHAPPTPLPADES